MKCRMTPYPGWQDEPVSEELDPADVEWAETTGIQYGAWWPDLTATSVELSRAFSAYISEPITAVVTARAHLLAGRDRDSPDEFTDDEERAGALYLVRLSTVATREVQDAVHWRARQVARGLPDPGMSYVLTRRNIPGFREQLDALRDPADTIQVRVTLEDGTVIEDDAPTAAPPARSATPAPSGPRPLPQPYGVNHEGAERLAADWMRHLGAPDAVVTQYSGDGGVDVESATVIAQVKNLHPSSAVPFSAIRDLLGTAHHRGKGAMLFTSGRASKEGLKFATESGIAIIRYDAEAGSIQGLNAVGARVVREGIRAVFGAR